VPLKAKFDDHDSLTPLGMVVSVLLPDWEIQYGEWSSALVGPLLALTVSSDMLVLALLGIPSSKCLRTCRFLSVIVF
jgi:hypothetical protein